MFTHFFSYYIFSKHWSCSVKIKNEGNPNKIAKGQAKPGGFKTTIWLPIFGMELLLVQLIISIYLAICFDEIYQRISYLAQIVCICYPFIMGSIKSLQNY
mmetsp:Transcript_14579/g.12834  ORF Transcript_14579/g.12834 Transcript_14579/m.12834 type:complete len:100 (-) Transcript_14579:903-1202(-)